MGGVRRYGFHPVEQAGLPLEVDDGEVRPASLLAAGLQASRRVSGLGFAAWKTGRRKRQDRRA